MKNVSIYWWVLVIMSAVILISCEEEEVVVMSKDEQKLADSIYRRDVSYVRKRADSLCDENFSKYFDFYVDSLKQSYIDGVSDIEKYLKSNK